MSREKIEKISTAFDYNNKKQNDQIKDALNSVMDIVEGGANTTVTPEQTIKNVFLDAYNQERTIQYTIIADSLRAGSSVELVPDYYREVLSFIDIDTYMSAASGITSSEWVANTNPVSSARMSSAVSNILGVDGIDTVLDECALTPTQHHVAGPELNRHIANIQVCKEVIIQKLEA